MSHSLAPAKEEEEHEKDEEDVCVCVNLRGPGLSSPGSLRVSRFAQRISTGSRGWIAERIIIAGGRGQVSPIVVGFAAFGLHGNMDGEDAFGVLFATDCMPKEGIQNAGKKAIKLPARSRQTRADTEPGARRYLDLN